MRTWLVLAAVSAVAAVAAADALRGGLEDGDAHVASPTAEQRIVPPGALSGLMGTVFYSDLRDGCRLKTLEVAGFESATPPHSTACRFSLSPGGQLAVPGRVKWSPIGGRYASSAGGVVELHSAGSSQVIRFTGRSPAFKPDGTITYTRGDELVERTSECQAGARLLTDPGDNATARCIRTVYRHRLPALAWFSNSRFAGVLARGDLVIVDGGRVVVRAHLPGFRTASLELSPKRTFATLWLDGVLAGVFDAEGGPAPLTPVGEVASLAWAPSERWVLAATRTGTVFLLRPNVGDARVRRLGVSARDVAWR